MYNRDGDQLDVCCCCGTEYLVRAMYEVTASGLMMCRRCYFYDQGREDELEEWDDE